MRSKEDRSKLAFLGRSKGLLIYDPVSGTYKTYCQYCEKKISEGEALCSTCKKLRSRLLRKKG